MTIRAIIFDLGGVLVRTEDPSVRAGLATRLGTTSRELEDLVFNGPSGRLAQLGQVTVEQHWESLAHDFRLSAEEILAFQQDFFGGDRLDLELVNRIRSLRGRYRTALLSNYFSDLRRLVSEHWQFADAFDVMIISSEVGITKPDARIYHLAVEKLGVWPEEAVFVDDFRHNVDGARAAGLHVIHFRSPAQAWAELEALLEANRNAAD